MTLDRDIAAFLSGDQRWGLDAAIETFFGSDAEGKDPVKEGWVGRSSESGEFTSKGQGGGGKTNVTEMMVAPSTDYFTSVVASNLEADKRSHLPEKKPGRSGETNPLPMPSDYVTRLNRKLSREAGTTGQMRNQAVELAPGVFVGDLSLDQWKQRTEALLTSDEIDTARRWYKDALPTYESYFGKEKGAAMLGAWLIANQNATPSFAQLSALRTLEQTLNRTPMLSKQMQGGLAHDKLMQYWDAILSNDMSKMPQTGQKIYDFVDSALGKDTRTFYGDDPRAGAPAVADVHSLRDMGFVDDTVINWVRNNYGDDIADSLDEDPFGSGGPSETQYENAADKMRAFTEQLNQQGYRGGDWEPMELQAVGWTAMSKMLGRKAETPAQAIYSNIRNLSYELDFAKGAPYNDTFPEWKTLDSQQKEAVGHAVLPMILDFAKGAAGAEEAARLDGLGGWKHETNPSFKSRLVASEEVAADVADIIGYLAQQTKVMGYRYMPTGKRPGMAVYSEALRDRATAQKLWDGVIEAYPKLAAGFSPSIHPDGTYGIEIVADKGGKVIDGLFENQLSDAIDRIAKQLNIAVDIDLFRASEESREHNWEQDPSGGSYTARLVERYGPAVRERLEFFKRQELEPAIVRAIAEVSGERQFKEAADQAFDQAVAAFLAGDAEWDETKVKRDPEGKFSRFAQRAGQAIKQSAQKFADIVTLREGAKHHLSKPKPSQLVKEIREATEPFEVEQVLDPLMEGAGSIGGFHGGQFTARTSRKLDRLFSHLGRRDRHILRNHLARKGSKTREVLTERLKAIARSPLKMVKDHFVEQIEDTKLAATGLATLFNPWRGPRQVSHEQYASMMKIGLQLLGTAVAIHSEEALAALPAAHVALTVGKHAVKYVIFEHLRHAGIGIAHFLATGDASPDLTDSDIEVLQRFADEIADAVQNLELSDEQIAELLAREAGIEVDDDDDESFDAAVAQFFTRPSPARSGV